MKSFVNVGPNKLLNILQQAQNTHMSKKEKAENGMFRTFRQTHNGQTQQKHRMPAAQELSAQDLAKIRLKPDIPCLFLWIALGGEGATRFGPLFALSHRTITDWPVHDSDYIMSVDQFFNFVQLRQGDRRSEVLLSDSVFCSNRKSFERLSAHLKWKND